jgi:hypothetical protein
LLAQIIGAQPFGLATIAMAGDPLERLAQVIDFEVFSGDLEAALSHSGRSAPSPAIARNN